MTKFNLNKEKILCAAVWYDNFFLNKEEVLRIRGGSPVNIDRGIVFCGHRHHNCIYQAVAISGKPSHELGEVEQGFLTSKNRFVGREEALKIALRENQVIDLSQIRGNQLYSEDLY